MIISPGAGELTWSRGQTCRTVDCLQSSLFTVLALFCVVGDCSFVDRRRGWMFWNRTMRARGMFGRLYAVIFVGLLSAMCQPGTSRRHTNCATHARSATTTMDSALQLSIVTGSLLSDTHRDVPAQQTEVHRPFSYFLQYTRTVAQN